MKVFKEFLIYLKDLFLEYIKSRIFPVTILFFVLTFILVHRLFYLQIQQGETYTDDLTVRTEKTLTIPSIRGNIYDRNGKLLASSRMTYNLTFGNDTRLSDYAKKLGVSDNVLKNQVVSDTIDILESQGDKLRLDFPIVKKGSVYAFTISGGRKNGFLRDVYAASSYDELTEEEKASTAADVLQVLTERFDLTDEYSETRKLQILGCRYMLWLNRFQQYKPVEIAQNISEKSRSAILENQDHLFGMDISVDSMRVYNDAKYFAHIIGYVGKASEEDLERLNSEDSQLKYTTNDIVGKTGVEQIYEAELHGRDGSETMLVDNLGKVMEVTETRPAEAGQNVYLTIDADLTKYCYDMLEKEIASILLAHMLDYAYAPVPNTTNIIPVTDVYAALFSNNQISLAHMQDPSATSHEREVYSRIDRFRKETVAVIRSELEDGPTAVSSLSQEYQDYMEYICEMLAEQGLYKRSMVDDTDSTFQKYVQGSISLQAFLRYLISIEAIDVSSIEKPDSYYDSEEIYQLLRRYILEYLSQDEAFTKMIIRIMLQQLEISGKDVIDLVYEQGVLDPESDQEYKDYSAGAYDSYEFIRMKIRNLDITPAMLALKPCSGSVVVTDVRTGEVRALVSYPSYDNNYLTNYIDSDYYEKLLADQTTPLINRATSSRTAPGSTYKIISAITGVEENALQLNEEIQDKGVFEEVYTKPACWLYNVNGSNHGMVDIPKSLDVSCNYFYYVVGHRLATQNDKRVYDDASGIRKLEKYASMFGLDSKTGIEVEEISPHISDNDAVTSAIGQGRNSFAPVHLSRYVSTVANNGTCYNLTLLSRIEDGAGNIVKSGEHTVYNQVNISSELWDSLHSGLRQVVTHDLEDDKMLNGIKVHVAGKTGTAQESQNDPSHGLFISYAPYESPEFSVTTVIQYGYASANAAEVTGFIYAYMYDKDALTNSQLTGAGKLSD